MSKQHISFFDISILTTESTTEYSDQNNVHDDDLFNYLRMIMKEQVLLTFEKQVTDIFQQFKPNNSEQQLYIDLERAIKYLPHKCPNYRKIMLNAIRLTSKKGPILLKYAPSDWINNDYGLASFAFLINGDSIQYISNRNFVMQFIRENYQIFYIDKFKCLREEFIRDDEIAKMLLSLPYTEHVMNMLENNFRNNPDLLFVYIHQYWFIRFADKELRNNQSFVLRLVEKKCKNFQVFTRK